MFTGIVRELGEAVALRRKPQGALLTVRSRTLAKDVRPGDSVSVNGACLTVTKIKGNDLDFDLSGETLRATTLGSLKQGEKVNLEPALRASDPLGGHIVTGHVDAVGAVRSKKKSGDNLLIEIEAPQTVLRYLVEKGSVAVDGISLTVVDVLRDGFTVVIIPHTAANTTIGFRDAGSKVNLEADIIGKYVERFVARAPMSEAGLARALFDAGYVKE